MLNKGHNLAITHSCSQVRATWISVQDSPPTSWRLEVTHTSCVSIFHLYNTNCPPWDKINKGMQSSWCNACKFLNLHLILTLKRQFQLIFPVTKCLPYKFLSCIWRYQDFGPNLEGQSY